MSLPQFNSSQASQTKQTGPVTIEALAAGWESRTIQEALDELARELGVRERVFVKWLNEQKHTRSDACDRLQRMIMAASLVQALVDDPEIAKQVSCHLAMKAAIS
jgi:hypothetical protein